MLGSVFRFIITMSEYCPVVIAVLAEILGVGSGEEAMHLPSIKL